MQLKHSSILLATILYSAFSPPSFSQNMPMQGCYPGLTVCGPASADKFIVSGIVSLVGPANWEYDSIEIADGTVIQTNGYPFRMDSKTLLLRGVVTVRSFGANTDISASAPAENGANGASFELGPNSEGPCPGCQGRNGGAGSPGHNGNAGLDGADAGMIDIVVRDWAWGNLVIRNTGMTGGKGTDGGNGGRGGDGEQGGRAIAAGGPFGIKLGCVAGPGKGGDGGNGGAAGAAGTGGNGGRGGELRISVFGDRANFKTDIDLSGGDPGEPGRAGLPGLPGRGGLGGRGAAGCEGREFERRGADGLTGQPGRRAQAGNKGSHGQER